VAIFFFLAADFKGGCDGRGRGDYIFLVKKERSGAVRIS
jgi:hypothetical protein